MVFYHVLTIFLITLGKCSSSSVYHQIMETCNLLRTATTPNEIEGDMDSPVPLHFYILLDKMIGIDDRQEVFETTGALTYAFQIECVRREAKKRNATKPAALTNADDYWLLPTVHWNSRDDTGMERQVHRTLLINPDFGILTYSYTGVFRSSCTLRLKWFPVDTQKCTLEFALFLGPEEISVRDFRVTFVDDTDTYGKYFITENVGWELLNVSGKFQNQIFSQGGSSYHIFEATISVKRLSRFYVTNVLLPSIILSLTQYAALLIPPDSEDRPMFAVTILLSFAVVSGTLQASIPTTPAVVILSDAITIQTVSSMVICFYTAFICAWSNAKPEYTEKKIFNGQLTLSRTMDVGFTAALIVTVVTVTSVLIHVYAAV